MRKLSQNITVGRQWAACSMWTNRCTVHYLLKQPKKCSIDCICVSNWFVVTQIEKQFPCVVKPNNSCQDLSKHVYAIVIR